MEEKPNNKQAALSSIETKYTSSFAGKTNYVDINGLFARLVDKKEMNGVVRLNNGYLVAGDNGIASYNDSITRINDIVNTKEYLDLYQIPFVYVQTPHTLADDYSSELPLGYETHINGNTNRLLEGLEENRINFIDLRDAWDVDEVDHYKMFLPTDHHWTFDAAFLSHQYLVNYINDELNIPTINKNFFNIENYIKTKYNNIFSGSYGNKTGILYAGVSDLNIIIPKFETNLFVEINKYNWSRTGDFEDVMFNYKYLDYNHLNMFSNYAYSAYLDGSADYVCIQNLDRPNNKKILLIVDSYSKPLAPFLALHFSEVHMYDVRTNYGGSTEGFIQKLHEIQPDIVLQIRTTNSTLSALALEELELSRNVN